MLKIAQLGKEAYPTLVEMYKEAFSGFPWYEELTQMEVERRITTHMAKRGFDGRIAANEEPVGASWWDTPTLEELSIERGPATASFAREFNYDLLVWERELLVRPRYQGKGYSMALRQAFIHALPKSRILILTRMRDDNVGTLRTAFRLGFQATSIANPSRKEGVSHKIYYLHVDRRDSL